MTETQLSQIDNSGETVNTFDLYDPLKLDAVLTGSLDCEGPVFDVLTELPTEKIRPIAESIRQKLDANASRNEAFVLSQFMSDSSEEEQKVFFTGLVDELRELVEFLLAAADAGHRIKVDFSF